jgi:hypothetical protein
MWGWPQVAAVVVLSVSVRWGPVETAVNGTVVARPARATLAQGAAVGFNLDRWVRSVRGDHLPLWRAAEASAAAGTPEFYAASASVLHMPHVGGFLAVVSTLSPCTPGKSPDIVNFRTSARPSRLTALETR